MLTSIRFEFKQVRASDGDGLHKLSKGDVSDVPSADGARRREKGCNYVWREYVCSTRLHLWSIHRDHGKNHSKKAVRAYDGRAKSRYCAPSRSEIVCPRRRKRVGLAAQEHMRASNANATPAGCTRPRNGRARTNDAAKSAPQSDWEDLPRVEKGSCRMKSSDRCANASAEQMQRLIGQG